MIEKVYLLWNAYVIKEVLVVGSLSRIDTGYCFRYEEGALKAKQCGCMLPFPYTDDDIYFSSMPPFFYQRMLRKEMIEKLGLHCNMNDELSILTCNNGIRNSDNFAVVREEILIMLKGRQNVR